MVCISFSRSNFAQYEYGHSIVTHVTKPPFFHCWKGFTSYMEFVCKHSDYIYCSCQEGVQTDIVVSQGITLVPSKWKIVCVTHVTSTNSKMLPSSTLKQFSEKIIIFSPLNNNRINVKRWGKHFIWFLLPK